MAGKVVAVSDQDGSVQKEGGGKLAVRQRREGLARKAGKTDGGLARGGGAERSPRALRDTSRWNG